MADTQKFLDLQGLALYHEKAKSEYDGKYAGKDEIANIDLKDYATDTEVTSAVTSAVAEMLYYPSKFWYQDYIVENEPTPYTEFTRTPFYKTKYSEATSNGEEEFYELSVNSKVGEIAKKIVERYSDTNLLNKYVIEETYAKKSDVLAKDELTNLARKSDVTEATKDLASRGEVTAGNEALTGSIEEVKGNVTSLIDKVKALEEAGYLDQEAAKKIIAESAHLKKERVDSLPDAADGVENVIYLVPKEGEGGNVYDEYLLINGVWEKIGDTATKLDLSGYPTKDEMNTAIGQATGSIVIETISIQEIDALFA